jgi:hypothetical protein
MLYQNQRRKPRKRKAQAVGNPGPNISRVKGNIQNGGGGKGPSQGDCHSAGLGCPLVQTRVRSLREDSYGKELMGLEAWLKQQSEYKL